MIVVDTNVVANFLLPGAGTAHAERVRAKDNKWIVPQVLRFEMLNVVAREFRANHLSRDAALRTFRRGMNLVDVTKLQSDPLFIFNFSQATGCSPCDLEFVWLAMELGVPLVTADQQLLQAFPAVAIDLSTFG